MSENMSPEDIRNFVNRQQADQNLDATLEQLLMKMLLDPTRLKRTRSILMNISSEGVISETLEATLINEAGILEEIRQENIYMLDDGTSRSGVVRCQTCYGVIDQSSLRRCQCGKTCCVRPGCAMYSESKNEWYCCGWHDFFRGVFGMNLR